MLMIQLKKKISLTNKVLILVAVRLKSARLSKKALEDLCGGPLIIRLTERVRKAKIPNEVIWCTSSNSQDDPLEQLALKHGISCFRGSELDVMSRFIQVADQENASNVVRVTGDNPLTDPFMMDSMIKVHLKKGATLATGRRKTTFEGDQNFEFVGNSRACGSHNAI